MSRPVVTALPAETVALVAQRMREHKVGSVVVVDHDDRAIGILTERDMIRLAAAGSDASTAKVSEWMTADPDTIGPDVEARAAFASLAERGYRHIPVVDDGAENGSARKLVGIVSMRDVMRVAMIQPADAQAHEVPKGLEGVVVADTTVGDVRGLEGFYHYRQYSAVDLAKTRPIEDVWQLMFEGRLPTTLAEREAFAANIRPRRAIPPAVFEVLPAIAGAGDVFIPLDALRTALSQYGAALGFRASHDIDAETLRENAMSTCAVVPTLICALWRLRRGLVPVPPRDDLAYAANYLYT
jgi:CBS domain-containing protein